MKLILNQEVANLGGPGDVVEVKDGYGRNFLVPRGYAQRWTKGADKQIATIRRAREVREVRDLGQAQAIRAQLAGLKVTLPARSGDGGRLFGSVTTGRHRRGGRQAGGPKLDKRLLHRRSRSRRSARTRSPSRCTPRSRRPSRVDVVAAQ